MVIRNTNEQLDKKFTVQRIATLDFTRGLAIFLMTFFHSFYHVFKIQWFIDDPKRVFEYKPIFIPFLLVLLYLGTWNSLFLLVSCIVNTLGMVKGANSGSNIGQIYIKKMITGIWLLICDYFCDALLYNGYFGQSVVTAQWATINHFLYPFFRMKTLRIIAYSIIITSTINYFLLRKNGHKKYRRNVGIYFTLLVVVLILTQFAQNWIDNMPWRVPEGYLPWPDNFVQFENASAKTYFCVILAGNLEPIFPFLASGLIGSILGLTLAKPDLDRRFIIGGFAFALGAILTGGLLILFKISPFAFFFRSSIATYLVQIGSQLILLFLTFGMVEFQGRGERFAERFFIKLLRRWGLIALTIYVLEIYDFLPEGFLNLIAGRFTGYNFFQRIFGQKETGFAFLTAIFCLCWYEALVRLWSLVNFTGSLEWMLLKLQKLIVKQSSKRLDVDLLIDKVDWIRYSLKKTALVKIENAVVIG